MDDSYDYNILGDVDPDDLYEEVAKDTREVCSLIHNIPPSEEVNLEKHIADILARLVFGSNMIEKAGAGLDITIKLCQAIFRGEDIPEDIGERDPEYEIIKRDLMRQNLPASTQFVFRSRREIIQHARATSHIIRELYLRGKDLTDDIILETHRILTHKVDADDGAVSWTQYSGVYRREDVCAGLHQFPDPRVVPSSMARMVEEMNHDLEAAEKAGKIDPVAFSAKYCHTFVNIHPFLDGNGRMCRLILNAVLLKYGGTLVHFGEHGDEREEYASIATSASLKEASDMDDWDVDEAHKPKHYKELASFTLKHFASSMRKLTQVLKGK